MIRNLILKLYKTRNSWLIKTMFVFEILLVILIASGIVLVIIVL